MQEKDQLIESLNFLLSTLFINCLFVEVSNDKTLDFLKTNSCFLNFRY